ncbi:hypothetical protein AXE65_10650 [Ventosimonas gracilis]|uniref:Anti sigma-E protein RseA N-terminal domain-containing protein n=1 Tax=Ventosimonas gracilis TaxID=1680762 RepID=A0A139SX76_9GAMM|nr:RseA family anti-sigma factor [Ventosimonas gracilis]KXU39050.1 hypothetical protein AXE65_10650 [Ventosimonas gracilis]
MNQNTLHESLSALMDGEASELELQRLLKQSESQALRQQWQRWQIARAVLHGQKQSLAPLYLAERVSAALHAAPKASPIAQGKRVTRRGLWRVGGQWAMAASVTLAVLGGVRFYQSSEPPDNLPMQTAAPAPFNLPLAETPQLAGFGSSAERTEAKASPQWPSEQANWQQTQRLRNYLLQHHRQSAQQQGIDGMLPDARAASFNER